MLHRLDLAVADHHVGVPGHDRRHERDHVGPAVLVVCVRVDDHVRPELERGVEPGLEAPSETLVVRQAHDVVDAVLARDLDRAVGRAVVDHQELDHVEAWHLARQLGQRDGERRLLVLAGDLDDQLHRTGPWTVQRPPDRERAEGPGALGSDRREPAVAGT
jgi:hypothetical protein